MTAVAGKGGLHPKDDEATIKKPTIVRLDPALKKKLKHLCIEQEKSLNAIIEEALVDYLAKHR